MNEHRATANIRPHASRSIKAWGFFAFLLAISFSFSVKSLEHEFDSLDGPLNLLERSNVYQDTSGQLDISDMIKANIHWQPKHIQTIHPPKASTVTWVKVILTNLDKKNYYRYIAFDNPLFNYVDAYIYKNGEKIHHYQAGAAYPFKLRPINNRNFLFPLQINTKDTIDIYFKLSDVHSGAVSIILVSPDYYAGQDQLMVAGLGLYGGLMAIIFTYYIAIFFVLRRAEFISYSCFVLISTLFVLSQHGITFQFLWPSFPGWAVISDPVLLMLSAASAYWFLQEFCHLKTYSPFFYWVLSFFIVLQAALIFGFVVFNEESLFSLAIKSLIPGVTCALIVITRLAINGSSAAKSFALAWIFLAIGVFAQVLPSLGYIEHNLLVDNGFMIGNIFYVVILSFSLASLVQHMEIDRLQAISLNKTKTEFFAKMSHELRTPIHGVLGLVELLIDTPMSKFQKRYINLINITGKSLLSVINDLLDYSKIEAGEMGLNEENFTIKDLDEEISAIFSHNYKYGGAPLRIDNKEVEDNEVYGDKEKIKQVLINFLSNAFKFTQQGEVKLTIFIDDKEKNNYIFQVEDTGKGIDSEELEHLFDAFYQVKKHQSGDIKGTGLGLAICQQMVKLMGGCISVKSEVGKGTLFSFNVPLKESTTAINEENITKSAPNNDQRRLNVLVAEDNMTNQIVMQGMMKKLGHEITIVENGQDAIDALSQEGSEFDLVLMDHDMPVMNGIDATIALRSSGGANKNIPVVAMTAHTSEEVKSECLVAGMNEFLSKPVSLKQLEETINAAGNTLTGLYS